MNIKCNATHCKNFKHSKCTLDDIELNFNWDCEGYGCYCSQFQESKEYKQQFYKIVPYRDVFLVIQTNCMNNPMNYIKEIVDDIKHDNPYRNEITLIFDTLITKYSARDENRFFTVNYFCDKDDIDGYRVIKNSLSNYLIKDIAKITCDYLRNEYKISEDLNGHGFISKEATQMILNGMNV